MMTKKIPTRPINKEQFEDYWKKAQDFFRAMSRSYTEGNWNATALEGIHAAISAADTLIIFSRGYKSGSQRHSDTATLIANLPLEDSKKAAQHLTQILSVKNLVEYSGDNYSATEAQDVLKQVERFFNWVRKVLPK